MDCAYNLKNAPRLRCLRRRSSAGTCLLKRVGGTRRSADIVCRSDLQLECCKKRQRQNFDYCHRCRFDEQWRLLQADIRISPLIIFASNVQTHRRQSRLAATQRQYN